MDRLAELLRQGSDRLVELPNDARRFMTNPQAFTQLVTGKNPMPRETGFAAGAMSLPPTEMSVLDPNQAPYMQGYEQGEPFGIAAMALPFAAPAAVATAKALAPKAGMMAENYMVKQGMIQPLTAYHGTPHTIQGQFDIKKVGTGEGAQAYGHGMYFAEAPAVADQYRKDLSAIVNYDQNTKKYQVLDRDRTILGEYDNMAQAGKEAEKAGNLYKVDIPDADIPNMLHWDEKVPEDLRKRISAATMEQFGNGATGTSGEHLYKEIVFEMRRNGSKNPEADASKWLSEQGITGIRYLDEGSRNFRMLTPEESTSGKYVVGKWPGGGKESKQFDNLSDAQKYFNQNQTSNFVVFEPSNVKILEQNNKPVTRKELIQEQIDKIE
jgi:hypothetical protein